MAEQLFIWHILWGVKAELAKEGVKLVNYYVKRVVAALV